MAIVERAGVSLDLSTFFNTKFQGTALGILLRLQIWGKVVG